MKKILYFFIDFFLSLVAYMIGIAPLIIIFLLLYLIKYLIIPDLPFSIFLVIVYIVVIIYEKIKKYINKNQD
ncbi:MAG TPA: hypothetical protein DIU01_08160 [Flavobacterium sp.]|nr:hypothetical protein [Flavobacterium sp.]